MIIFIFGVPLKDAYTKRQVLYICETVSKNLEVEVVKVRNNKKCSPCNTNRDVNVKL